MTTESAFPSDKFCQEQIVDSVFYDFTTEIDYTRHDLLTVFKDEDLATCWVCKNEYDFYEKCECPKPMPVKFSAMLVSIPKTFEKPSEIIYTVKMICNRQSF